jgi:hypothetical protein
LSDSDLYGACADFTRVSIVVVVISDRDRLVELFVRHANDLREEIAS